MLYDSVPGLPNQGSVCGVCCLCSQSLNSLGHPDSFFCSLYHTSVRVHQTSQTIMSLSLLQLPVDVVRLIWRKLRVEPLGGHGEPSNHAQHALLCTCRAARALATPWITCMAVSLGGGQEDPPKTASLLHESAWQLAAFPAAATATSLQWSMWQDPPEDETQPLDIFYVPRPGLLSGFLFAARSRLAAVVHVTLTGMAVSGAVHTYARARQTYTTCGTCCGSPRRVTVR